MARSRACNADLGFRTFSQVAMPQAGKSLPLVERWFQENGGRAARSAFLARYVSAAANPDCDALGGDLRIAAANLSSAARHFEPANEKEFCSGQGTLLSRFAAAQRGRQVVSSPLPPPPSETDIDNSTQGPRKFARSARASPEVIQPTPAATRPVKPSVPHRVQIIEYEPLPDIPASRSAEVDTTAAAHASPHDVAVTAAKDIPTIIVAQDRHVATPALQPAAAPDASRADTDAAILRAVAAHSPVTGTQAHAMSGPTDGMLPGDIPGDN